jgi:hypothetical protein
MTNHSPIDPGPDHVTVFDFDGKETVFRIHRKTDPPEELPGDVGRWIVHVPDVKSPLVNDDDDDGLHWPGIIGPGQFRVQRKFENLEQMQDAMTEIADFVARVEQLHPAKPRVVLTAAHYGALDPAHVTSFADRLRRAGTRATIVVDHRSMPDL